jgi:hypothetical protein
MAFGRFKDQVLGFGVVGRGLAGDTGLAIGLVADADFDQAQVPPIVQIDRVDEVLVERAGRLAP